MQRQKERSFLERAMEALGDRFPAEKPTQVKLARIARVSQPAVFEWGKPDRAPSHASVLRLAKELDVCVEWLYTGRGPKHPPPTVESDPLLKDWSQLDEETRRQIAKYAEFLRGSAGRQ